MYDDTMDDLSRTADICGLMNSVVFEDAAVTMFFVAALLLFVLLLLLLLIQRQMLKVSMKIPVPAEREVKAFNFFSDWRTDCRF